MDGCDGLHVCTIIYYKGLGYNGLVTLQMRYEQSGIDGGHEAFCCVSIMSDSLWYGINIQQAYR
jgi:hypothetical protein